MKTKMVCMVVAVVVPASPISAQTTWYVDDDTCPATGSGTAGDPFCRIQDAIDAANPAGGDTIIIAAGQYNEHDITINESLTIQGAGAESTFVDGQYKSRVFYINQSTVDMSGMTIRNGNTTGDGGGIYNDSTLTLINCTVSSNTTQDSNGGGIANERGNLIMYSCTVSGNDAAYDGGGVWNWYGDVTMTNCTVSGNTAGDEGGGIWTSGAQTLIVNNCTVSNNFAYANGGGIYNMADEVYLKCSIVYGNTADGSGDDIYGSKVATECIIGDPDGDPDPLLGPLQDNGGPTETHALLAGSPAIDACIDCTVVAPVRGPGFGLPLVIDQRGLPRPVDGDLDGTAYCDVGAYEKQPPVGGTIEPVDRLELLAPWLALAAFVVVALSVVVVMRRRHLA